MVSPNTILTRNGYGTLSSKLNDLSDHWHVPALDGVRGIAILLVMLSHSLILPGGRIGVDLFFVLSGFLITTLLLREQARYGSIYIAGFYMRRALRLLPALVLVVAVVGLYVSIWQPEQLAKTMTDIGFIILYVFNWRLVMQQPDISLHQWMFSHVWSLSVEEQFYIVWPFLLVMLARIGAPRWTLPVIMVAGIVYPAVARAMLWESGSSLQLYFRTDLRIDGLMCGALVAWLTQQRMTTPPRYRHILGVAGATALASLIFIANYEILNNGWAYRWAFTTVNILGAVLIASCVWAPQPLLMKLLEMPWLTWVGMVSYGLYLWHWPVMRLLHDWQPSFLVHQIVSYALIFAVSALSFYAWERPIRRLKSRIHRPAQVVAQPQRSADL